MDFNAVRKLAMELGEVEESTAYGASALKVNGKLMVCIPTNKSAEPGSLMVRVDLERRSELIAAAPGTYYVTSHYEPYPAVLVRLAHIRPDEMKDLLAMAWRFVTAKKAKKRAIRGS
jgi:hypothetical protein